MPYSDMEKAEAIIRLAENRYNFQKTADQLGLQVRTLRRWDKTVPKKGVADLLERALEHILMAIPEKWDGNSWSVAVGILIDKYQLIRGEPTNRIETIIKSLEQIPDDELNTLLSEFEAAARRGLVTANSPDNAPGA